MPRTRTLAPALLLVASVGAACNGAPPVVPGPVVEPGVQAADVPPAVLLVPGSPAPVRFVSQRTNAVKLAELAIRTTVQDPLALTETTVVLRNDGTEAVEGTLRLVLAGSTLFAETESFGQAKLLRERSAGTGAGDRVYETAPFTIAAGDKQRVVVRHAAGLLGPDRSTALLLSGLPPVDQGSVVVTEQGESSPQTLVETKFGPGHVPADIVVRSREAGVVQADGYAVSRAEPKAVASSPPSSMAFLIDTSASRARDLVQELDAVRALAKALPPATRLVVAAYDEDVQALFDGPASDLPEELSAALARRGARGSSDSATALSWVLSTGTFDRIAIVTDGVDSRHADAAAAGLNLAERAASTRVDVVVTTGTTASIRAARLARLSSRTGRVLSLRDPGLAVGLLSADPPRVGSLVVALPAMVDVVSGGAGGMALTKGAPQSGWIAPWVATGLSLVATRPESPVGRQPFVADMLAQGRPMSAPAVANEQLDPLATLTERPKVETESEPQIVVEQARAKYAEMAAEDTRPPTLPPQTIQTIVRRNFGRFRLCYRDVVRRIPQAQGKMVVEFTIDPSGTVSLARALTSEIADPWFVGCMVHAFEEIEFPGSDRAAITVRYPFKLGNGDGTTEAPVASGVGALTAPKLPDTVTSAPPEPNTGDAKEVYDAIARGSKKEAVARASAVIASDPDDAFGYLLLGDALVADGDKKGALRAYASLLDLDPEAAWMFRAAAVRLRSLGTSHALELAEAAFEAAVVLDPQDPSALQGWAMMRARRGDLDGALKLLDVALTKTKDATRFPGVRDAVRADMGLVAVGIAKKSTQDRLGLERWLADVGATLPEGPAMRLATTWEGAETNVDLMVRDVGLWTATPSEPVLATGGKLVGDATKAPGMEAFVLDQKEPERNYPYSVMVRLSSSKSAYVAGAVEMVEVDASGKLWFADYPVLVQTIGSVATAVTLEGSIAKR